MLFNSLEFAVFLPIVLVLYALAGVRGFRLQNQLLVVASYVFYGWWDPRFLFLIVASTVVDYNTALLIDGSGPTRSQRRRASLLLASAAVAFGSFRWHHLSETSQPTTSPGDWFEAGPWMWVPVCGSLLWALCAEVVFPALSRQTETRRRKFALGLSLSVNLGVLGFFKYYDFFAESFAAAVSQSFGVEVSPLTLGLILPVGISFYTLQTISYSIDVYRGEVRSAHSLTDFAAYVSFFPQLVAGPIERGTTLIPQFQRARRVEWDGVRDGLWLIGWGLFKKVAIADVAAKIVNQTFGPYDSAASLHTATTPEDGVRVLFAAYAFALQIYADFSGYSDIARGTAKLLGFELQVNFRLPYFAVDPSAFWQRWHISLSSWLRDYLYIPLGGNRRGTARTYGNLLTTMLIGGLWHGASWTFVLWGAFHGAILVVYRALGLTRGSASLSWPRSIAQGLLMFHLVCFGWLLFRAQNLDTVSFFVQALAFHFHWTAEAWHQLAKLFWIASPLLVMEAAQRWSGRLDPLPEWPLLVQAYAWLLLALGIFVHWGQPGPQFIYFAF
jgi:D-alanyl-lipoteichoic acid acyltransferase DltB (MBOAT superfamily)